MDLRVVLSSSLRPATCHRDLREEQVDHQEAMQVLARSVVICMIKALELLVASVDKTIVKTKTLSSNSPNNSSNNTSSSNSLRTISVAAHHT